MKGGIEEGLCATACGQPVGSFASRPPHGLPIWTTADAFPLPRQRRKEQHVLTALLACNATWPPVMVAASFSIASEEQRDGDDGSARQEQRSRVQGM